MIMKTLQVIGIVVGLAIGAVAVGIMLYLAWQTRGMM